MANSGRDHIPGEMEVSYEKLKIDGLVKSRTLTGEVVIARRFSFIASIYNYLRYQHYKMAASAPRLVAWMSLLSKEENHSNYFVNLSSDSFYF